MSASSHPFPEKKKTQTFAYEIVHQIVNKYSCIWKASDIYQEPAPNFVTELCLKSLCVLPNCTL